MHEHTSDWKRTVDRMHHRFFARALIVLLAGLAASGCRSSREVVVAPPEVVVGEDFDPEPYVDPPPVLVGDIVHEVPSRLIGGATSTVRRDPSPRTVSGYRIQISSHRERAEANLALQETIEWWNLTREDEDPSVAPIYMDWEQPYWKIRVGNFTSRQAANRLLTEVRKQFEGAFVVPSEVEVR